LLNSGVLNGHSQILTNNITFIKSRTMNRVKERIIVRLV